MLFDLVGTRLSILHADASFTPRRLLSMALKTVGFGFEVFTLDQVDAEKELGERFIVNAFGVFEI